MRRFCHTQNDEDLMYLKPRDKIERKMVNIMQPIKPSLVISKKLAFYATCANLFGCATIVSDSIYPVRVESSLVGASVTITDNKGRTINKVETPTLVRLSAGSNWSSSSYSFTFEKKGHSPVIEHLGASINPWYFGNIVFGGLIGLLIVDPSSGAMWKLDNQVYGQMGSDSENYEHTSEQSYTPVPPQIRGTTDFTDASQKLQAIKALLDKGLISTIDYEVKKKEILDHI